MAAPHLKVRVHSRSRGHSAAAAIAYRTGKSIVDDYTGLEHNYCWREVRGHIIGHGIVGPGAEHFPRPHDLAFAIDRAERRCNSCVLRDIEVALPHELPVTEGQQALQEIAEDIGNRYHTPVAWNFHRPDPKNDQRNLHGHLVLPTRRIDNGRFTEKLRVLDEKRTGRVEFKAIRELAQARLNTHLERAGSDARVNFSRRTDRLPEPTLGAACTAMERRNAEAEGIEIDRLSIKQLLTTPGYKAATKRGETLQDHYEMVARLEKHQQEQAKDLERDAARPEYTMPAVSEPEPETAEPASTHSRHGRRPRKPRKPRDLRQPGERPRAHRPVARTARVESSSPATPITTRKHRPPAHTPTVPVARVESSVPATPIPTTRRPPAHRAVARIARVEPSTMPTPITRHRVPAVPTFGIPAARVQPSAAATPITSRPHRPPALTPVARTARVEESSLATPVTTRTHRPPAHMATVPVARVEPSVPATPIPTTRRPPAHRAVARTARVEPSTMPTPITRHRVPAVPTFGIPAARVQPSAAATPITSRPHRPPALTPVARTARVEESSLATPVTTRTHRPPAHMATVPVARVEPSVPATPIPTTRRPPAHRAVARTARVEPSPLPTPITRYRVPAVPTFGIPVARVQPSAPATPITSRPHRPPAHTPIARTARVEPSTPLTRATTRTHRPPAHTPVVRSAHVSASAPATRLPRAVTLTPWAQPHIPAAMPAQKPPPIASLRCLALPMPQTSDQLVKLAVAAYDITWRDVRELLPPDTPRFVGDVVRESEVEAHRQGRKPPWRSTSDVKEWVVAIVAVIREILDLVLPMRQAIAADRRDHAAAASAAAEKAKRDAERKAAEDKIGGNVERKPLRTPGSHAAATPVRSGGPGSYTPGRQRPTRPPQR